MTFDTLKKVAVTLKIKSRSPKSNQLFTPSLCKFGQNLPTGSEDNARKTKFHTLQKVAVTLKIKSRSPKTYTTLPILPTMYLCKFHQNLFNGSEDKTTEMKIDTVKKVAVTLKIKSRSPKSNPLFTPSQHCIYASLVKICPLVQKITPRNEISYITKGGCDLEN